MTTQTAEAAYAAVLAGAGCSLVRDAVDRLIVEEIHAGTARFGATYRGGVEGYTHPEVYLHSLVPPQTPISP